MRDGDEGTGLYTLIAPCRWIECEISLGRKAKKAQELSVLLWGPQMQPEVDTANDNRK